ncbi:hypothetical protein [Glutamicibacter sp. NPDC127525]|uniref:hypothetical protein n=1 Tax=unclassified Glutamicibacter TaxID=2627139 RepID=UPI003626A4B3
MDEEVIVPFTVHLVTGGALDAKPAPLLDVRSFYEYIAADGGKIKFPMENGRMAIVAAERINFIEFDLPEGA